MKKQVIVLLIALCLAVPAALFAQQQDQQAQQAQDQTQQGQQAQQGAQAPATGAEQGQTAQAGQQAGQPANLQPPLFAVSQLRNMALVDQSGKEVGQVKDAFLTSDGKVSHIVATLTGAAAQGAQAQTSQAPAMEQQGAAAGTSQGQTTQAPATEQQGAQAPATGTEQGQTAQAQQGAQPQQGAQQPPAAGAEQRGQVAQGQAAAQGNALYLIPAQDLSWQQGKLTLSAASGMNFKTMASPQEARQSGAVDRNSVLASRLMDYQVINDQGQQIGKVEDVVIRMDQKTVDYVAMNFSGILGVADKLFAVPYNSVFYDLGKNTVTIRNINQQALQSAQGFTRDSWPQEADPNWSKIQTSTQGAVQPAPQGAMQPQAGTQQQGAQAPAQAPAAGTGQQGQTGQGY